MIDGVFQMVECMRGVLRETFFSLAFVIHIGDPLLLFLDTVRIYFFSLSKNNSLIFENNVKISKKNFVFC